MATLPIPKYTLLHTPTGSPYIPLQTRSQIPIFLTELLPRDAQALTKVMSIPSINHALFSPPANHTLAMAKWWIAHQRAGKAGLRLNVLRAGHPESGGLIGSVNLGLTRQPEPEPKLKTKENVEVGKDEGGRDFDLGYYLHPEWQGKGILRPALRALIEWGRAEEGVETVFVRVVEGNLASRMIIGGVEEFLRCEREDGWLEWPAEKGGGRKKILVFEWRV